MIDAVYFPAAVAGTVLVLMLATSAGAWLEAVLPRKPEEPRP